MKNLSDHTKFSTNYFLHPGFVFVSQRPTAILTILGSCVSVCLHDEKRCFGGMNHFLLPEPLAGESTPRYGRPAILRDLRIPVLSEDVGGTVGRRVLFLNQLNHLTVTKLDRLPVSDFQGIVPRGS